MYNLQFTIKKRFPKVVHSTFYILHSQKGFTLLETLVAVVVIGAVGIMMADIIVRTFQANTKTALVGVIKQNGQMAMNIMESTIRSSDGVVCIDTLNNPSRGIVVRKAGSFVRFWYIQASPNSYIVQDNPVLPATNMDTDLCNLSIIGLAANQSILTNRGNATAGQGINVTSASFTKNPNPDNYKDSVAIVFAMGPSGNTTSNRFEDRLGSNIEFRTTVDIR
jgi:prepilin-type N-terminal cleavage/methylation domain-containing protein